MRLDPFFDIRDALRNDDARLAENAPAYLQRLLDAIEAIQGECDVAAYYHGSRVEIHAIREHLWRYGNP